MQNGQELEENLINNLEDIIMLNRYDVEGVTDEVFAKAKNTVFSELFCGKEPFGKKVLRTPKNFKKEIRPVGRISTIIFHLSFFIFHFKKAPFRVLFLIPNGSQWGSRSPVKTPSAHGGSRRCP